MGKIKQFLESEKGKDILILFIVILVGLASFELGRLSKDSGNSGIKIEYPNQSADAVSAVNSLPITKNPSLNTKNTSSTNKNFFASNKGSKYYSIGCSGGKTIKQENRIYFSTKEEAEAAGYALSSGCN